MPDDLATSKVAMASDDENKKGAVVISDIMEIFAAHRINRNMALGILAAVVVSILRQVKNISRDQGIAVFSELVRRTWEDNEGV